MMKHRNIRNLLVALAAVFALAGCRDDMPRMQNPRTDVNISNWAEAFESFWSGMNYNYVFWSIDPTDWDAVYEEYKPKFDALAGAEFDDPEVNDEAFAMIEEMTSGLIDGHYAVQFYMPNEDYTFIPVDERLRQRENYHTSELFEACWRETALGMIREGRLTNGRTADTGGDYPFTAMACVLDGDIVYFRLNQFGLREHLHDETSKVEQVRRHYVELLNAWPDVRGVVVDVRSNSGGYVDDLLWVLGYFVDEPHVFMYQRGKSGIGRLDYGPWIPQYLQPMAVDRKLDVPIVVLADMQSVSMAEMAAMAVLSLPNGCFVGERTSGMQGTLAVDNEAFESVYAGYIENNVYMIYTTQVMSCDVNGDIYEGVGVPPTIEAPFDEAAFARGVDTQLERAVEYIRTGR